MSIAALCDRFSRIIGGKVLHAEEEFCQIGIDRHDICPTILGVPIKLSHLFMIKCVPGEEPLIYGEMSLLEREVPVVVRALSDRDIIVSAIHNHWLFDRPRVMYIHFEVRMDPIAFAQRVVNVIP